MEFYISPDSFWLHSTQRPAVHPPLSADVTTGIAVIGAGITGLTVADALTRHGRKVVVLEAGRIGSGTTGGTSAHLDAHPEVSPRTHLRNFGEEAARTFIHARLHAIDHIERRIAELEGDCEFQRVDGYQYTEHADRADRLRDEIPNWKKLGLTAIEAQGEIGLPFPIAGAVRFPGMARFHPVAYLRTLADAVTKQGGTIHEQTRAAIPESGTPCVVGTDRGGTVRATQVVVATHSAYLGISSLDMRVAAWQSYLIAARVTPPVGDALYWDDDDPYHYTRIAEPGDPGLVLIGGADHKTGQAIDERDGCAHLEDYTKKRYGDFTVERRWSAELFASDDGVPFAGEVPSMKNVFVATGFSGVGLTFGTACANLITDLILERENSLAKIFSPSRFKPMAEAANFVKENLDVAKQYVKGKLVDPIVVKSLDEISKGEGRLVSYKGHTLAVYRDAHGLTHALSPACTHAGCNVHWNDAEHTWDCPCHGGRYAATGERIYGPPPADLERKALQQL
ncbi:MAG: FAD-dependent oxidoreductase [Planctomycetaceae bacterium]